MKAVLTNILDDLRGLYTIADRFERFDAYVSLSSGKAQGGGKTRGEQLPLGTFSPMGERQAGYLDYLIAMGPKGWLKLPPTRSSTLSLPLPTGLDSC